MTQAANKLEATKAVLVEILAPATTQNSDKAKTKEANIVQLNPTKDLNRFLEASCDCF